MAQIESLNHTAICVHDLEAALDFYCGLLGGTTHSRSNFQIEDARAGVAIFQSIIIEDYMLALTIAPNFMPMPPENQLRGAHGFREVQEALRAHGIPFEGPVTHPEKGPFGESIYLKDPSGNFLEFLWRRDEDPKARKRRFVNVE
jgi:extradiol dioxygenase family protein